MNYASQEIIAFSIVGLAAAGGAWGFFKAVLAEPLARWYLKRGEAKAAFKLRELSGAGAGCGKCPSGSGGCASPARGQVLES